MWNSHPLWNHIVSIWILDEAYHFKSNHASVHIQIPLTSYIGLIYCTTAVATASWSSCDGTLQLFQQELLHNAVTAAGYPQRTFKGAPTCSSHSSTEVLWDLHNQLEESGCVDGEHHSTIICDALQLKVPYSPCYKLLVWYQFYSVISTQQSFQVSKDQYSRMWAMTEPPLIILCTDKGSMVQAQYCSEWT